MLEGSRGISHAPKFGRGETRRRVLDDLERSVEQVFYCAVAAVAASSSYSQPEVASASPSRTANQQQHQP